MSSNLYFPGTAMPDKDWWHILWPDPRDVAIKMGLRSSTSVVDLCCGDGYFTAAIASLVGNGRVIAIDIDPQLLQEARTACREFRNCTFIEGDALNLPQLLSEPTDYIFIANTFHGVPNKTELARAVHAVLKPEGCFGIVNWHFLPREQTTVLGKSRGPNTEMRMSPEAVRDVVEPAGFTLVRLVQLPPYHYGIVFERSVS